MILVIDNGVGNLPNFTKALTHLSLPFTVSANPEDLRAATQAVLIGVGNFRSCMEELTRRGFVDEIRNYVSRRDRRLFGICVGMQMLFEGSEEAPGVKGLGLLPGTLRKLTAKPDAPVPHVGFDEIDFSQPSRITADLPSGTAFYFTHSFAVMEPPPGCWVATCVHGGASFVAAVDNSVIAGVQFHPEKSQSNGITMLRNALSWRPSP